MAKNGKQYAKISGTWEQIKPSYNDLTDVPTDFNPTTHTHGNMNDDGQITASANIATGDHLVIADHSANNDLTTSDITFDISNTTQFLRRDGNFATPAASDSTKLPLTGGTLSGDLTLEADGTGTVSSHGIVFTSQFNNGDVPRELNLNSSGGLELAGNEIYHEGHKPTYTELGTMAYSNLTGTPTIPTNNNQLTNGAGYITSFDITTQTDGKYLRSNANDNFSGTLNYTPDTGTILSVDGQAILQRMTANGAITIGHDDAVIIAGGDTSGVLNTNINNATETVFVGAEGGFVAYAFPNNNTAWSNRKEMNWNGTNLTLLGNNVLTTADEGSGNGLDADTLDGSHASAFAAASHTHSQYAPLASPALTGNPTAPTATAGDNDTTIATTAFVSTAISNLVNGASASFDTLKEIQDAMATDTELSNAIAGLTIGNGTQTITAGTGLSGGGSFTANQTGNSSITLNLDFSELTDITLDVSGSTEMVVKVGDTEGRKALSEIDLSAFNNDAGWTSNVGDITNVTAGTGLTGGGSSGSVTVSHADTSSQGSVNNSGNTFIQDITLDGFGHITGITSASAGSDSTKLPLTGGTLTGDLVLDHDGETTANDSHGVVFTARFNSTDFTRELYMDDEANLLFGTNTIFHSGNDGSSSGLHADLLDGQQGSYYLNYNNFTNTPTIPTNNNQLTNGAGYTTNTGTVTNVTVGIGLDVTNGTTTPGITLDLSEFTDMTADVVGTSDELILLDSGAERRKLISEIKLSQFNNDAGWTSSSPLSTEQVQDIVGGMVSSNSESGLSVAYDDTNGKLNFALTNDPTITLTGDVSGSGTMTNLGSVSITATVADDSHNHTIANVDGLQTALDGKAASSHQHAASNITSGEFATARLGSGNANTNYVLKSDGDGTASWQADSQLSTEAVQDIVGGMVSTNTESGIAVTYDDTNGKLNFNVSDPTITLTGDVTGSATMTNLGNVSITATVADDSHNHTIANVDGLQTALNGKLGSTATAVQASAVSYVTSCPTSNNTTGMKVYVGSTDCSTKYSGWLYLVT